MSDIITITMNPALDVSASTEHVVPIRKNRCEEPRRDPGGGGINVARVITRLGARCRAVYPAGGSPGDVLHRMLDREGVTSLPLAVAEDTRESFTVLERSSGRQFRFVLPGAALRDEELERILEFAGKLIERDSHVVASGSLPPGVPADFLARLACLARAKGARLYLDSTGEPARLALDEGVFLFKPNLRELRDIVGLPLQGKAAWEAAAAEIVEAGRAEIVTLTLGEDGAFLIGPGHRMRASGLPVKVASAVGAGDSFLAAMVWRLARGGELAPAFANAVAAGTAALLTPGTELCRPDDVERLLSEVRLSAA